MVYLSLLVVSVLISASWCKEYNPTFPPGFKFGVSTSSYQIEGGWNVSDKGESIWDRVVHSRPEVIADGSNGDVACDSYHLWRRDLEMIEELGAKMYRFSISWPRLLPTGFPNMISADGARYYSQLIDRLLEKGIEPMITLFHYDLPIIFQDLGGWTNPLIADWFADYARVVFDLYADRVKLFITINEPLAVCDGGYYNINVPFLDDTTIGLYLCTKNLLMAHAKAYRIYDEEFRSRFQGKLSFTNLFLWFEPESPNEKDVTKLILQQWEGRFSHPVHSELGGWPSEYEQLMASISKEQGYSRNRLPPFTEEEIAFVRGTADFYALNHYTTRLVRNESPGSKQPELFVGNKDLGVSFVDDPKWENVLPFFAIYPEGLRAQLHWINNTYGVKEIIITENGVPTSADLNDFTRLTYMRDHLQQVLLAISDGINVTAYCAWSLMDNFEWAAGYVPKFGLYAVNFTDPNRTRTPRASARFYAAVTRARSLHVASSIELK